MGLRGRLELLADPGGGGGGGFGYGVLLGSIGSVWKFEGVVGISD